MAIAAHVNEEKFRLSANAADLAGILGTHDRPQPLGGLAVPREPLRRQGLAPDAGCGGGDLAIRSRVGVVRPQHRREASNGASG